MPRALRRPGSPWRILVHTWTGGHPAYGKSHHVTNERGFGRLPLGPDLRRRAEAQERENEREGLSETVELPGTEFDELVVGHWIHLEQMNPRQWWMSIGGVVLWVTADRDGRPRKVQVFGPGDYEEARPGCEYELKWTEVPA